MSSFRFKQFTVEQGKSCMKVGTDALVFGAMIKPSKSANVLDIGAGTGVLSLMLAQKDPSLRITAIEIDSLSAEDCMLNFSNSRWKERLDLIHGDFLKTSFQNTFDLILTNPPFYSKSLKNDDQRKARSRHEEFLPFNLLIARSADLLTDDGHFWVIVPFEAKDSIVDLCALNNLFSVFDCSVNGKPGKPVRSILCFRKGNNLVVNHSEFTVRDTQGNYTEEYKILTRDFHDRTL